VHTITFDNGKEFAAHQDIAHALKTKIFFATPYHAWERGLVPIRSELKKRLRGRLESWAVRYADLIDQMLANSARRPRRDNREPVAAKAFDQHCPELGELFTELVSELKRASV
jgi:hypothetical protein